jgi:C1A family cysteine protease
VELSFNTNDIDSVSSAWEEYKEQFQKNYITSEEETKRKQIWYDKTISIMKENADITHTHSEGWNDFTDMSEEEFKKTHLGYAPPKNSTVAWGLPYLGEHRFEGNLSDLPSDWDWSMAGQGGGISVVTQVKNQGQCGSCWAFSTTGALEGAHSVANGIDAGKISMSEQQLIDCSGSGCGGGSPARAIEWEKGQNVCQEQSYPYKGSSQGCRTQGCTAILNQGSIWGHYSIQRDEGSHCSGLMQRPLSVVVAVNNAFQRYHTGILNCPQGRTDHAILLVGYGYLNGQKYWKVKNSWGTRWGLDGFGLLARGIGGTDACSVLSGTNGAYVYGPYNPQLKVWNKDGKLVENPGYEQSPSISV